MDSTLLMDPSNQIIKPAADHKAALTSVTPSNVGHDNGVDRQLSDDAAAPNFPTSSDEEVKPSNQCVAVPEVPQAPDTFNQMESPFAAAVATALAEGDNNSDSFGDEEARVAAFAELMELGSSAAFDASRQHHLLRHSLPNEQRGTGVLSHFGVDTISDAAKIIKKMSQRELQAKFKLVYGARTFSNNNNWLRRKLFEAIGLDPSKGAVKKPGAGTQRRRRTTKPAAPRNVGPRLQRRTTARGHPNDIDSQPIAEALIALGELASLAYDGYDLDDLEEAANAVDNSSDGRVPSGEQTHVDDGRLSSPEDGGEGEDGVRGVPRAVTAYPEAAEPQQEEGLVGANDSAAAAAQMSHVFEWIAHMQRQAMEAAGPQHAAMMAAMMSNPAHAQQAQQMQALQLAAMAGHPHAQQVLHAMMVGAGAGGAAMPAPAAASMEMLYHMMQEAQQQHQQSMMQQNSHPQLVPPMFAGQK